MDAAERFDADLTARWSDHIASCVDADDGGGSFEAFIERHPNLRRSDLFRLPAWKGDSGTKRLFRTAAPYYARYRTAYPPELIALLARRVNLNRSARVLDLGCGPGSLAIPIAAYAGEVVAVDPEPEMIAELRRAAPENVTAIEARAEDVDEGWGRFELATAGRAFHWFDAPLVLGRLAAITPV
ncbi:MAG: class I SAM-dependent methyltransferase, partial [Gaiellaceae bacterium]